MKSDVKTQRPPGGARSSSTRKRLVPVAAPLFSEPGWGPCRCPTRSGSTPFQAARSPAGRYRTAQLRGLWTQTKGGFYHDGGFETLLDVIHHYNANFTLGLHWGR